VSVTPSSSLYSPHSQDLQALLSDVRPVPDAYLPFGQGLQLLAVMLAVSALYFPSAQLSQALLSEVLTVPFAYLPDGQGVQL